MDEPTDVTPPKAEFVPSALIDYGTVDEVTQAGVGGASFDGSNYS